MKCVIADTGPLVTNLDRQDRDHSWAVSEGRRLPPKMLFCEAVLSEVHFLTRDVPEAKNRIGAVIENRADSAVPLLVLEARKVFLRRRAAQHTA